MEPSELASFEAVALPHLNAAYTLARYLTHDEHDAEDAVQDAYLRALRYFGSFRGGDGRTWILTIVRHSCYALLRQRGRAAQATEFDEALHSEAAGVQASDTDALRDAARTSVEDALRELPDALREVIVLREIQELSYREISKVAGIPVGTVMSRLSRARDRLQRLLARHFEERR